MEAEQRGAPTGPPPLALLRTAAPPLLAVGLALVLASLAHIPLRSADTYFHLRFGHEFLDGWSISHPGFVTKAASNDWVPTQWLPQVGLYLVADAGGREALAVLFGVLLAVLAVAIYLLLRSRAGASLSVLLTAVVLIGAQAALSLRPQVLSFLFVVLTVHGWDRARRSDRPPWWLVPLAFLWAMCHGMWILGVAISVVLAVGVLLETRPQVRGAVAHLAVPVGMLVAACVTPAGPRLLSGVLLVNSRSEYFTEWAAPELTSLDTAPVTILLAAAVVALVRRRDVAPYDLAMLALGGIFSIYSQRTLPLALIILATIVAREIDRLTRSRFGPRLSPSHREKAVVAGMAALCILVTALLPGRINGGLADDLTDVDPAISALPEHAVVLTDHGYGAVLLWTHPGFDIPVHGYGDIYTDGELAAYDDMMRLRPGWDRTLRHLGVSAAVLPENEPMAYALEQRGWTLSGSDDDAVVLVPPPDWASRGAEQ